MDRCPSELWTRIFGLACMESMDGGFTGCSIAHVSRYFHAAVLPVQLYSVALSGAKKTSVFADLLEQREPAHRRVRHLMLSSDPYIVYPLNNYGSSPDNANNVGDMDVVLSRILVIVAPDLLTLVSTWPHRIITEHNTLDVTFPRLTKLSMSGGLFYPPPITNSTHDYFPSLQYLRIPPSSIVPLYTSRAPRLTHLQLDDCGRMDREFQQSLQRFLSGFVDIDEVGEPLFPSTIQKIMIARNAIFSPPGAGRSTTTVIHIALLLSDKDHKLEFISPPDSACSYFDLS